ncbi:HAD family phosphatase [Polymorphospora sp. NPDC050346]|uniref:HAD family phosphatase n=1 Tax=Polymorphospora sp. NPDC050346 TaxID=3155780 RepID=UPI0033E5C9D6
MTVKALIFDFDGLPRDTETTLLESWRWEWRRHGLELDLAGFFADHGGDANEPRYAAFAATVYDREASHALRMAYRAKLNAALEPAPGIVGWLDRAAELGLRLAAASSSPVTHVGAMLDQAGLRARFEDTAHGVAAAHAAGLRCVAVPNPHADHARFAAADLLLTSAADLSLDAVMAALAGHGGRLR